MDEVLEASIPTTSTSTSTRSTATTARRRNGGQQLQQRQTLPWATALTMTAILASQESTSHVQGFQTSNSVHNFPCQRRITSLSSTTSYSQRQRSIHLGTAAGLPFITTVEDSFSTHELWGYERPWRSTAVMNLQEPSRMFLKAGHVSNQPMSALSSKFFDATTTTTSTINTRSERKESLDQYQYYTKSRRSRGTLGFALPDLAGDQIITSFNSPSPPPSVEVSSTRLHSSTQREAPVYFSSDFDTWRAPSTLDEEEWLSGGPSQGTIDNPIFWKQSSDAMDEEEETRSSNDSLAWFPWMPTISQIEKLKVRDLRKICTERGLEQSGKKVDLQQRLWEWTRQQQHRQRGLVIDNSAISSPPKSFRLEGKPRSAKDTTTTTATHIGSSVNSLGEWARTYDIEPLLQKREQIHKEKREGKAVARDGIKGAPDTPTKEYLSKLFDAPPSQYSNLEVTQMYAAAKAADQSGDRALSRQILYKLKEATPHDARIYRRLARMESEEGSIDNARRVLQEGLQLHPENAYIWHGLGQLENKAGNDSESRKCFGQAIKMDPAFPNAYHAWGIFEHSKGNIARAMKILKKGLEYCPTNHRLHHALGDLYREAKMLDMAEKSFRRALEHGPEVSRPFAYTSLAYIAYELGEHNRCRSWLKKAVAINNGRHAKGWLAWARFEESENNFDAARSVCVTALNQYEKGLLKRGQKIEAQKNSSFLAFAKELCSTESVSPNDLKDQMMKSVPRYRSGDHFLKVYRNWIRLEERYGSSEAVDEVYKRASAAFAIDWKLTLDWARYHDRHDRDDRARELYGQACDKVDKKHAEPYRLFGEFEMKHGNYLDARGIFYRGALAMSESADSGSSNQAGIPELYYSWAVCEWGLEKLSRAQVLLDHALRLTSAGKYESALRSSIFFAIARLEFDRREHHLAQHNICLCLQEDSLPGGNAKVWKLWAEVARSLGDKGLAKQCYDRAQLLELEEDGTEDSGKKELSLLLAMKNPDSAVMNGADVQSMMRKDPWHYKLFGESTSQSGSISVPRVSLPGDKEEIVLTRS